MNDLISRQAAIDALCNQCSMTKAGDRCVDDFCQDVRSLKEVTSAQKKGKWIIQDGAVCCSECGESNMEWNFCPNCGADMRGEEK